MCGFLGIYGQSGQRFSVQEEQHFRDKASRLAHRGNTGKGELLEPGIALYHYRLAFRGLADGAQPLSDLDNRASIIFNGELYDYSALRNQLASHYSFRSHADTEVILASYLVNGADKFLSSFDGEFAFVIWDRKSAEVIAARDPFGVKPIFLAAEGLKKLPSDFFRCFQERYEFFLPGRLEFASEMKGLAHPLHWEKRGMERQLLGLYEEMGTAFSGVIQLPPGSLFRAKRTENGFQCVIERKVQRRRRSTARSDYWQNVKDLKSILARTVQNKLAAEVPLGAYLSGGVDSRIAAFEMSKNGAEIPCFTVGFEGKDFDETEEVSQFLRAFPQLKGRALRTTNEALEYSYPHAIYASELIQPYTNGAAKWWLSRFARRFVRGVLTGDGADEIFCGYPSYRYLAWWQFYQRHPSAARAALYQARVGGGTKAWEKGLSSLADGSDLQASVKSLGWAHPLFSQVESMAENYFGGENSWLSGERESLFSYVSQDQDQSPLAQWQNYFLHTHFPTHVLNWVGDRMEMANTLEGRPIFISREILNFMAELPDEQLVRGMRDKAILRRAYSQELKQFSRSPKKQFNAPFLQEGKISREFFAADNVRAAGLCDPSLPARLSAQIAVEGNPLTRSYLSMLRQNLLVLHMLDRYLVKGEEPARDISYEEKFLDERIVSL